MKLGLCHRTDGKIMQNDLIKISPPAGSTPWLLIGYLGFTIAAGTHSVMSNGSDIAQSKLMLLLTQAVVSVTIEQPEEQSGVNTKNRCE